MYRTYPLVSETGSYWAFVILVCSTAGQTGSPGSTSMPGTPTSPKGTGSTGGLNPPDVDSTDSNAEHLATASLPSLALTCFMYMFLQLWWCMDDLVRFSRALGCSIVARDVRDTTTVLFQGIGWLVVAVVTCRSSESQECPSVGFSQLIMLLFLV